MSSLEGDQSIRLKTVGNDVYIYPNNYANAQKTYVHLDIEKVPELERAVFVCWQQANQPIKTKILFPKAKVVYNNLSSDDFQILTEYAIDERGIPNVKEYHQDGCFEFNFSLGIVLPKGNAILNR